MAVHSSLTGADLHESKGVDSAGANTVYVANGAGSGAWVKLPASAVDGTVKNLNQSTEVFHFPDIGTSGSRYKVMAKACMLTKIWVTPQANMATTATVLTIRNDAGTSMGTITIPSTGTAGAVYSLTPVSNNTFVAGSKLQIDSDGGTSTSPDTTFTLELTWT